MDFIDRLNGIGARVETTKEQVHTEEATKNAFVMPFIAALGYDVFNPLEVVPEFTADVGIKKGEKVDYCIMKEGKPVIIIECKHWRENLNKHGSQLHRYFHVVDARFGILTNGIEYRIYTDLEDSNKMDSKPFLEFHIDKLTELTVNEIKKFQKSKFDVEEIVSTASDLKYSKEIKGILKTEFTNPSEDFVKLIAKQVYIGRLTSSIIEQFTGIIKKSLKEYISETITERLQIAEHISETPTTENLEEIEGVEEVESNGIITTEEELQAFRIVQAILIPIVESSRITHRDTKSYFGVLLDNNNRKPVCRLHLDRTKKYLEVFDENKKGVKYSIETVDDIYTYKEQIVASLGNYIENEIITE
jgi:hypothetical protein